MQVALGLQQRLAPSYESSADNWRSGVMTEQEDPLIHEPRPPKQLKVVHRAANVELRC